MHPLLWAMWGNGSRVHIIRALEYFDRDEAELDCLKLGVVHEDIICGPVLEVLIVL